MPVNRIYLDHAATTPLRSEVREAMLPWIDHGGNPSSLHSEGRRARAAIDEAREKVARRMGCDFAEVVFTSGGTEACNLAIVGHALANETTRFRILISAAEHACVWAAAPLVRRLGYLVESVSVDALARPILPPLDDDVLMVVAMAANNELGTVSHVDEIATAACTAGATYFCDAVQAPDRTAGDLMAIAGHKIGGPRGVGALVVRAGTKLSPFVAGGAQERERRGGTEDVAAIVGLGAACSLGPIDPRPARDAFLDALAPNVIESVQRSETLSSHAHVRFPGVEAETLLLALDRAGIAASAGAACASGSLEPSHVLLACGWGLKEAKEGVRFTFGWTSTVQQAVEAAERINSLTNR
jgi:cysteine desulfurase